MKSVCTIEEIQQSVREQVQERTRQAKDDELWDAFDTFCVMDGVNTNGPEHEWRWEWICFRAGAGAQKALVAGKIADWPYCENE